MPIVSEYTRNTSKFFFLDGIRGVAAICVCLFHLYGSDDTKYSSAWMQYLASILHYGWLSVAVFIVLSGYCLMLPVCRSEKGTLNGGLKGFFIRRSRRILPPYFAALIIALVLSYIFTQNAGLAQDDPRRWSGDPLDIASHILLVHNVKAGWTRTIDPPMWSIAMEWQIYFVFALILLPVWQRYKADASLLTGVVIGFLPLLLTKGRWFWWTSPWMIGLFAMGMWGACINFPAKTALARKPEHISWSRYTIPSVAVLMLSNFLPQWGLLNTIILDFLTGFAAIVFIVGVVEKTRSNQKQNVAVRILESRPALTCGHFSFSIYLVHYLVIWYFIWPVSQMLQLTQKDNLLLHGLFSMTSILAFSYLFHLVFERPFMKTNVK